MCRNPYGIKYINETVKMTNDYDRAKKKLQADNEFLRNQIRSSTGAKNTENSELEKSEFLKIILSIFDTFL